jgi:hypothetical protein
MWCVQQLIKERALRQPQQEQPEKQKQEYWFSRGSVSRFNIIWVLGSVGQIGNLPYKQFAFIKYFI